MPTIQLTNNASVNLSASAQGENATLNRYLKDALTFRSVPALEAVLKQPMRQVNAGSFALSAVGSGNFAVEGLVLNVQAGSSASISVLKDDDKSDFLESLKLSGDFAPDALVSFSIRGSVAAGLTVPSGNFSFGVSEGAKAALIAYCPAGDGEPFGEAIESAIEALTIPHDLDDLNSIPPGSICELDASSSLQFTASVSYTCTPLASKPVAKLPFTLQATAGATLEATATHTGGHAITIAKLSENLIHLAVSLKKTDDFETSLTVSAGLAADLGQKDALQFLLSRISPKSDEEMKSIAQELPAKAREISEQIKDAIDGAVSNCFQASLKTAIEFTGSRKRVFVYAIDLSALDTESTAALRSAMRGDFRAITKPGAQFAGIREINSALTTASKVTHALGIHLLGVFNFASTHEFLRESKVSFTSDKHDIVLSDQKTQIATNNLAPEKLRQVVVKDVTLTLPASANTPESDTSINMVFFDREASPSRFKFQQFVNTLQAIAPADAGSAASLLSGHDFGVCSLYLELNLAAEQCKRLYLGENGKPLGFPFYIDQVRGAMQEILAGIDGDTVSAVRMRLFSHDPQIWNKLRVAGARDPIILDLKDAGFRESEAPLLVPDVMTAVWWSEAMAAYAKALASNQSLVDAGARVAKDSDLGYNEPWLILACWNILSGQPRIESRFTSTRLKPAEAPASARSVIIGV